MRLTSLALVLLAAAAGAAEHRIKPGEDPQAVLDAAAPGDKLAFLPGLHQHGLKKHRSILYVDKSVEIELMAGATLKLADGVCRKESIGEITTDQDSGKKLDDLEVGGAFDLRKGKVEGSELFGSTVYTLIVTGGKDGAPDTLAWGDGKLFETPHQGIPLTGDWQELSHGVKVRFAHKTGHGARSLWFVSYDAPEAYGIDVSRTQNSSGAQLGDEGKEPYFRARSTALMVDETIKFAQANKDKPFYVNLWTLVPHAALKPTPEQLAVYAELQPKADDPAFGEWTRKYYANAKDLRSQMQVFCASLTDLDTQIEGSFTTAGGLSFTASQNYAVDTTAPVATLTLDPLTADNKISAAEAARRLRLVPIHALRVCGHPRPL